MYIGLFCCNAKYVDNYALQTKVASYTKTRGLMKSARIISPGRFEVFDEKTPSPGDGKLLVRLLRAAICGSDLPYFSRSFDPTKYPFPPGYPGHECMGVVEESHNGSFKPGDRVMYYPTFLEGYREYHLADPSRLQKLPRDFDMNLLVMTQLLGAVAHCAFRIDRPYNRTVVIMGQGPVGLLFTSLMKNFGARRVVAVDPLEYRLGVARRMGADHTVNPEREDLTAAVSEMTDGAMADIVIEAYGQDVQVINACFDIAAHNGQVAFFGICLDERPALNFNAFFRRELRMVASVGPDLSVDYPFALDMIIKKTIDVSPIVTHSLPFEDIQKGFETAVNRADDVVKVILEF